jgi:hypothetical protein
MSDQSENSTPFDTFMKHTGFVDPMPLAQLLLPHLLVKGQIQSARWVQSDIKHFVDFQTDLVLELKIETAPKTIVEHYLHIEFQRTYVKGYKFKVHTYRALLMDKYETENITSFVIYCGDSPCTIDFAFINPELPFKCHLYDLCTTDLSPLLSNDSIYVRLFAIFNTTLDKPVLAHQVASAIAAYCRQHPDTDLKQIMERTLSICSRTKMSLYMEIEALLKQKEMLAFDYRQSFAYEDGHEEGETEKAVNVALKLMQKKGWTVAEVADVLELSEAELAALRAALEAK